MLHVAPPPHLATQLDMGACVSALMRVVRSPLACSGSDRGGRGSAVSGHWAARQRAWIVVRLPPCAPHASTRTTLTHAHANDYAAGAHQRARAHMHMRARTSTRARTLAAWSILKPAPPTSSLVPTTADEATLALSSYTPGSGEASSTLPASMEAWGQGAKGVREGGRMGRVRWWAGVELRPQGRHQAALQASHLHGGRRGLLRGGAAGSPPGRPSRS